MVKPPLNRFLRTRIDENDAMAESDYATPPLKTMCHIIVFILKSDRFLYIEIESMQISQKCASFVVWCFNKRLFSVQTKLVFNYMILEPRIPYLNIQCSIIEIFG